MEIVLKWPSSSLMTPDLSDADKLWPTGLKSVPQNIWQEHPTPTHVNIVTSRDGSRVVKNIFAKF
jgi:hypothetical protein